MHQSDENLLTRYQNVLRGAISEQRRKGKDDKRRIINGRAGIRAALLKARERLPRQYRKDYFAWLNRLANGLDPDFRSTLSLGLTSQVPRTRSLSVASELEWIGFRLAPYLEDIRRFRGFASDLDQAFWEDRQQDVAATIDAIRNSCGDSLWLLAAEIAFEQEFYGLEAQKKILERVKSQYPGGLPAYFAFYFSIRNEERSPYRLFYEEFQERVSSYKHDAAFKTYIKYKVLGSALDTDEAISSILRLEQQQSIFDVYETTIDMLQRSIGLASSPKWADAAVELLKSFQPVGDWRVNKILGAYDGDALEHLDPAEMAQADPQSPIIGREPAQAFWRMAEGKATFEEVRGAARSPREALVTEIFEKLVCRSDDFEDSLGRLAKFTRNFSFLPGAKALGVISDLLTAPLHLSQESVALATLNDRSVSAIDLLAQRSSKLESEATEWWPRIGREETRKWSGQSEPELAPAVAPFDWLLYTLRTSSGSGLAAIELLERIPHASLNLVQEVIRSNLELRLLLETGEWKLAVQAIARAVAKNANAIPIMPVRNALADRAWDSLVTVSDKLDLALALYTYWRQTDDSLQATHVRFSFEEVLFEGGYALPSQIEAAKISGDPRFAFFLEHVCVPALMDTSGFFASTAELLDERLKILELLQVAMSARDDIFQDQIDAINAAKLLKSGLELVDSNRVAVDLAALNRWAVRKFRASYARYQALSTAGIGIDAKFQDVLDQIRQADASGEYFSVPTSEADTLLLEIILGLKAQFLSDPQYGLEYFLGKRIRHGTIAGHIRGPVENSHLITERRTLASPYEENSYWLDRIPLADTDQRQRIVEAFGTFSEKYDKLISDVRDKSLHVTSTAHPDGLFDVVVTAPQFHVLKALAKPNFDFEQFLSVCFQMFWVLLSPSLAKARELLTVSVREDVVRLFGELQAALDGAVASPDCIRNVTAEIQAVSTDVQRELDIVGSWFERVEGGQSHRFSLHQAIEISVQSALKSLTSFHPAIEYEIQEGVDTTQSVLLLLWEFIFVALDNAHRRARAGQSPSISLTCAVDLSTKRLMAAITNPIGSDLDMASVQRKLTSKRESIAAGDIVKGAQADRGSGLLKVASLVRDFTSDGLHFELDEAKQQFTTSIDIPVYVSEGAVTLPFEPSSR